MKKLLSIVYVSCLILGSFALSAQGPEPPPEVPVPIDDYLPLLVIAGFCFASFVIYKRIKVSHGTL